jgi:hypothetical protein
VNFRAFPQPRCEVVVALTKLTVQISNSPDFLCLYVEVIQAQDTMKLSFIVFNKVVIPSGEFKVAAVSLSDIAMDTVFLRRSAGWG